MGRTRKVPRLEYQQQFPAAHRELTIARNLKRYAELNMALIVILSASFFEFVWPTSSKPDILREILNYGNKRCLHLWASGVNLSTIKRHCSALARPVHNFRSMQFENLQFMLPEEAGIKI